MQQRALNQHHTRHDTMATNVSAFTASGNIKEPLFRINIGINEHPVHSALSSTGTTVINLFITVLREIHVCVRVIGCKNNVIALIVAPCTAATVAPCAFSLINTTLRITQFYIHLS